MLRHHFKAEPFWLCILVSSSKLGARHIIHAIEIRFSLDWPTSSTTACKGHSLPFQNITANSDPANELDYLVAASFYSCPQASQTARAIEIRCHPKSMNTAQCANHLLPIHGPCPRHNHNFYAVCDRGHPRTPVARPFDEDKEILVIFGSGWIGASVLENMDKMPCGVVSRFSFTQSNLQSLSTSRLQPHRRLTGRILGPVNLRNYFLCASSSLSPNWNSHTSINQPIPHSVARR